MSLEAVTDLAGGRHRAGVTGAGGVSERDRSPLCEKGVQVQSPPSYLKETFTLAR
jgi:hypothetical protein